MKRIRWLLFMACALGLPLMARAQSTANLTAADSGPCTTANACLQTGITPTNGGAVFTLGGTFSGTVQFEGLGAPTAAWAPLNVTPSNSGTAVTSATAGGTWQANIAGYIAVRIRCSTYASGSIVATINVSTSSARAGGGGNGASGTVSGQANGVLPLATGATAIGAQSHLSDNGTTVASSEPFTAPSLGIGASPPAVPVGVTGVWACAEASTAVTPASGIDFLRCDSVSHQFKLSLNGGSEANLLSVPAALSSLATQNADTVVLNASGSAASPIAVPMPTTGTNGCAGTSDALNYNTTAHSLGCTTIPSGGITITAAGTKWYGFSVFTPNITTNASAQVVLVANQPVLFLHIIPVQVKLTTASVFVNTGVAASTGDIGIYSSTGTLLAHTGSFATATTGQVVSQAIVGGAVTLNPGTYYLAACDTSASVTMADILGNGTNINALLGFTTVAHTWGQDATDTCTAGVLPASVTITNIANSTNSGLSVPLVMFSN